MGSRINKTRKEKKGDQFFHIAADEAAKIFKVREIWRLN
jgi:hypothetical protein